MVRGHPRSSAYDFLLEALLYRFRGHVTVTKQRNMHTKLHTTARSGYVTSTPRRALLRHGRKSEKSAQILNDHYAAISTDAIYQTPPMKLTAADRDIPVSDYDVFRLLDTLKPTATGLDGIPAWFLRLERRYLPRR